MIVIAVIIPLFRTCCSSHIGTVVQRYIAAVLIVEGRICISVALNFAGMWTIGLKINVDKSKIKEVLLQNLILK